jgi:hypothetical protein
LPSSRKFSNGADKTPGENSMRAVLPEEMTGGHGPSVAFPLRHLFDSCRWNIYFSPTGSAPLRPPDWPAEESQPVHPIHHIVS